MRIFILLAALVVSACAPMPEPTDVGSNKAVPADNPAACATPGGDWQPICMMGKPACVITYKDAGKACTDGSQCSGNCVTTSSLEPEKPAQGVCTTTSDPCGCKQFVENGKASYPLCAD